MIGYSVLMVSNQVLAGTTLLGGRGMDGKMAGSTIGEPAMEGSMAARMGVGAGMVALAVSMLVNDVPMTRSDASM